MSELSMSSEEEGHKPNIKNLLQTGATLTILLQLLIFFLSYKTNAEIILLGTGWILLFPGFAILLLFNPSKLETNEKRMNQVRSIFDNTRYPSQMGWIIISICITLINQSLLSFILTIIFITFLVLLVREDNINPQT